MNVLPSISPQRSVVRLAYRWCVLGVGAAFVSALLALAISTLTVTPRVQAAGCSFLTFTPTSGSVGTRVTVTGYLDCTGLQTGKPAAITVKPGPVTSPDNTYYICKNNSIPSVTVANVAIPPSTEKAQVTFTWPAAAGQLGQWTACAWNTDTGDLINSGVAGPFTVVPAPTPTSTPHAQPTMTPTTAPGPTTPTPRPSLTPSPTPMPTPSPSPTPTLSDTGNGQSNHTSKLGIPSGNLGMLIGGAGVLGLIAVAFVVFRSRRFFK